MKSPVNGNAWFVRFAAIALFCIPIVLLKIEINTTLRVIAVFMCGVIVPIAFLKFAFKTAAIQLNQSLRAPCGVLSSGFTGTAKKPSLFTVPGFTFLLTVAPSASLSILLEYPFRTTGMLMGVTIGCLWSFATIWILWRFMNMAELQNAQCQPGMLYDAYGEFQSGPPQDSTTHNSETANINTIKTGKTTAKSFAPPSDYQNFTEPIVKQQHAVHHFNRGIQHANQQHLLRELQQQRVARQVMQSNAPRSKSSIFKLF